MRKAYAKAMGVDVRTAQRHQKAGHPDWQRFLGNCAVEGVKRQDRINWRVRLIEGGLTDSERRALAEVVEGDAAPLSEEEKGEWLSRLGGVSLVSDGFIPFRDNIEHATRYGVAYVAQPGGSVRDDDVNEACREHRIAMVHTGVRTFHH